ncbi:MAG TPA: MXAN_6640 family putative metalloprotease, partial [Terriglobales bacterium]|nr:MXAN_6640 family putative metalloprotease [Terriglobales bacterium]
MNRGLTVFSLAFLLVSLACQTMTQAFEPAELTFHGSKPTHIPAPTATPLPPISSRLNGDDLPVVELGTSKEDHTERSRPRLSGTMVSVETEHFRVHYTLEGDDAVAEADDNGNGQPNYIEDMASALEYSWFAEIDHFGWAPPPSDGVLGGDEKYDIYLANILPSGYAGFTAPDENHSDVGDNLRSSTIVEKNSTHSYIALDNDYVEYDEFKVAGISRKEYMQSVVAHEFNHAIQFGYDGEEPDSWLWEATATWMEDEVFNDVNETVRILKSEFKSTDTCQLSQGGEFGDPDAGHWYGMWIFMRYVSERYGDDAVRRLWELAVQHDGYAVWDAFLAEQGIIMEDFYKEFAVALLSRNFEEGQDYPTVRLEGHASGAGDFTPTDGVQQFGADYIEILGHDIYTVKLNSQELIGMLVAVKEHQAHIFPMQENQASIDTNQFEHTYIVVLN